MKKLTAMIIDTDRNEAFVKEVDNDTHAFYDVLNCECFDIARRRIGGKQYCILCDDNGLFANDPILTAINPYMCEDHLVGNLMIVNEKGSDLTSLTKDDIVRIAIHFAKYDDGEKERIAVMIG